MAGPWRAVLQSQSDSACAMCAIGAPYTSPSGCGQHRLCRELRFTREVVADIEWPNCPALSSPEDLTVSPRSVPIYSARGPSANADVRACTPSLRLWFGAGFHTARTVTTDMFDWVPCSTRAGEAMSFAKVTRSIAECTTRRPTGQANMLLMASNPLRQAVPARAVSLRSSPRWR